MRVKRFSAVAVAALLVAFVGSSCEWPASTRYVHQVFTDTDATKNVVYRHTTTFQGQPIDLTLDVYQPHGDVAAKRPVVMWMFGGAWVSGDKSQMTSYATDSATRGYVGVSISYRIRPGGTNDIAAAAYDAYDDAVAAVAWLKANAATYRIDPDAVVAAGWSAGAINAMNLLYVPGTRGPATSPVAAGIAIAGVSMVAPSAGRPPSIMHHGDADTIVPYASGQSVCNQANAVGDHCELVTYPGGTHYIATSDMVAIASRSAVFVFEQVLLPRGYPVHTGP